MNTTFPKTILVAAAAGLMATASAYAEISAVATTDLNIRSGPGPAYEVIGAIAANDQATVMGCIEGSQWCEVSYNGQTGWAYSAYLTSDIGGSTVVIAEAPAEVEVPVVTYDAQTTASTNATVGAAGGAITGALIGGPVGAAIGGVAGATVGAAATPPEPVREYIVQNRVEPVYLEGEVVVGAGVPDTVELLPVPETQYVYQYINGQPVVVDPGTRQIVYVYR